MKIREANIKDVEDIVKFGSEEPKFIVGSESGGFWTKDQIVKIIDSNDILLVAGDDRVIGFVICFVNNSVGKAVIENIFVDKDYRSQGIASDLMSKILVILKERNCGYISALIKEDNNLPLRMFDDLGFNKGYKFYWMDKKI